MTTIREKLTAVFLAAEKLNENLWLDGIDCAAMSVDEFKEHVERTYNVNIEFFLLDVDEVQNVYGFIERYGEGGEEVRIYIAKSIGPRWLRIVGTKELCQVVLDTMDDFQTDGEDTLQRLVAPVPEPDAPENAAIRSEWAAEYLAWELIYPHEFRRGDVEKLQAKTATVAELGIRYGVPNHIVETVLSKPYMEFADRWWAFIWQQKQAAAE